MIRRNQRLPLLLAAVTASALAAVLLGCEPHNPEPHQAAPASTLQPLPVVTPAASTLALWQQQQAQITTALDHAEQLNQAIAELLHAPTPEHLSAARTAWQSCVRALEPLATIEQLARKQPHPTWQALATQFTRIAAWPSRLGYLDDNGIHGATGLIFDLDTPITAEEIRHQHQLTGDYDLTTGLYPIGQLLMGYGAARDAQVFSAVDTLTDALRVKGFEQVHEVPSNRRRQLIELQGTLLLEDIRLLGDLWQARQSNSALNAFSQMPQAAQRQQLQSAAIDLVANQLHELHEQADKPIWHTDDASAATMALRLARWEAQLEGAQHWLDSLGIDSTALATLRTALAANLTNTHTTSSPTSEEQQGSSSSSSSPEAVAGESAPQAAGDNSALKALFAEAILALKPGGPDSGAEHSEASAAAKP